MAEPEYRWIEEPLLQQHDSSPNSRGKQQQRRLSPAGAGDVEAPPRAAAAAGWEGARAVHEEPPAQFKQSSLSDTTLNLTNAILGAGMLSLPHAFAGLGVLGGVALIATVAAMTYASISVMLRTTERTGKLTYAAIMEHEWGRWAALAVRLSIIVGSAGFLVLYLIVLADLLVGSGSYSGIIPDLWPQLPNPLPWYLGRTAVLTWATLLVAPSLLPKTLGGVATISVVKVICSVLCVSALVSLWAVLLAQGRLPPVQWLPDPGFFGHRLLSRVKNVLAVVPVVMTAFVCHMSVHPLVQDLHDYTPRRMRAAVAWSMLICGTTYAAIGASGLVVFGQGVKGDVLSNLGIDGVADIMWGNVPLAMAFVATVKVSMAVSMVMSFPITIWPMRQDIIEMLAVSFGTRQLSSGAYYTLTYLSLLLIYLVALSIKSAYQVVGLVGATTGITMAFIFPGMLALQDPSGGARLRAFGWLLLLSGTLLMLIGMASASSKE